LQLINDKLTAQGRHGGGCHPNCCAQFHQEQRRPA
jgi:hypothetical protein